MAHIDFSTDILKHYVRTYGWLPACHQQKCAIRGRSKRIPLRYFTFCAAEAIDVSMLERAGILLRNEETGRLEGVFFCETDEGAFGRIADLIGSPEQGFLGDFAKIVLFEDDEETQGRELFSEADEPYPESVRRKLMYRDANHRLRKAFPFDVINLDVCGIMFPPRIGVIAPLLRSLLQVLTWQTASAFSISGRPCKQFTLFLTSHIDRDITDRDAVQQLINRMSENIDTLAGFRSAFGNRYGHFQAERLADDNFPEFFCLALPKFLIHSVLFDMGWDVTYSPIYLYNRGDIYHANRQYQIMHSVSVYTRMSDFGRRLDEPGIGQYARTVDRVINEGVTWVDEIVQRPAVQRALMQDLRDIVEFRDRFRRS